MSLPSDYSRFISSGDDRATNDIIADLKFIARIKPGEKIYVNSRSIGRDCIMTSVYRTFLGWGESREKTLNFIQEKCDEAHKCLEKLSEDKSMSVNGMGMVQNSIYDDLIAELIKSLKSIFQGLAGIRKTYEDDRMFTSKIDTFRQNLVIRINNFITMNNISTGSSPIQYGYVPNLDIDALNISEN